jgi:hypothetical protein
MQEAHCSAPSLLCVCVCCLSVPQASLQGPEVQVTLPTEEDLSPFTNPTSSSSSSSSGPPPGSSGSSWSSAAVNYSSPAAAGGVAGGGPVGGSSSSAVGADLEKKAASVVVFEGQTLSWTLSLTNISSQPITGCKVGSTGRPACQLLFFQLQPAGQPPGCSVVHFHTTCMRMRRST